MTRLFSLALAALLSTAAMASAQDGPSAAMSEGTIFNDDGDNANSTATRIEFARVDTSAPAVIEIYEFTAGEMGSELLGSLALDAGTNFEVKIPIKFARVEGLIAVLKIDGEIVDRHMVNEGMGMMEN